MPGLLVCVAICEGAGALGGLATSTSVTTWYPALAKPAFTPPAWLFGPAWTLLYALMGGALWLVWRRRAEQPARVRPALWLFAVQLALNVAWSYAFFAARSPRGAVAVIAALLAAIGATAWAFARVSRPAAWMLAPYAAWVVFAAALNVAIAWLNPGA